MESSFDSAASLLTTQHGLTSRQVTFFWGGGPFATTFFDVRVFNPYLVSGGTAPTLAARYRRHECSKKRLYEQRIWEVDGGSFTPLVFSCSGGVGPSATRYLKRLASLLLEKGTFLTAAQLAGCRAV